VFFYLVVFVVFLRLQKKKSFYFRKDFVKFKRFFFAFDKKVGQKKKSDADQTKDEEEEG